MKKAISLVGVGAMVLMLGLGSGLAQQSAPKDPATAPVVTQAKPATPADAAKEKTVAGKPGTEVKVEKAAPATPTVGKEAAKATSAKTATPAPPKGAADQATEKSTVAKPIADTKVDKTKSAPAVKVTTTDSAKSAVEKAPEKAADVKTPVKQ